MRLALFIVKRDSITKIALWILLFVLILAKQPLLAQNPSEIMDTLINIDQVSIVRDKVGADLRYAPLSASTIDNKNIKLSNIRNIKDFSLSIPNMFMPDYGTKLTSPVYIRGIGSRINSPSVGLYVDGVPFFEKSAFDFDFADVYSIDVLRGPQGTLYGRNTMGGIISVTTRSPLTYNGTSASITYGNHNRMQATFSDYRKITDNFGYSISGNYEHNDGYFTNIFDGEMADKMNSGGGRLQLRYKKKNTDIHLTGSLEYSDQGGYPYGMLDKTTGQVLDVNYNAKSFYRRLMSSNGLVINHSWDKIKLTSRTSHQYTRDHQGIDQDFSPQNIYYINQREQQNMISQELQLSSRTPSRVEWIAGVFGFHQQFDSRVTMDYFAQQRITDKFYDTPRSGAAIFGQATINDILIDGLSATIGARYDHEFAKTKYDYYTLTGGTANLTETFKSRLNDSQFTPKVSLQYNIKQRGLVYATLTKGFKAGGFNTSFVTEAERTFDPEYSWNYEVGGKFNFADNRVNTSLAFFYIDWSNQQVYQPLSTGQGSLLRNAAKSASKGIEVSAQWNITKPLILAFDYGFTHAVFKQYEVKNKGDYSGNWLPYIPRNTVSARLDYTFSSIRCPYYDRILFGLQYNGVGGLYWNDSNTVFQKYYNTLNAKVAITKNFITLALWAKNITSASYAAFYFEALGNSYIQKGRPFTFGADLSFVF